MRELLSERVIAAVSDAALSRGGLKSNYGRLFGTPERAARTLASVLCDYRADSLFCEERPIHDGCYSTRPMLEWLRGDA